MTIYSANVLGTAADLVFIMILGVALLVMLFAAARLVVLNLHLATRQRNKKAKQIVIGAPALATAIVLFFNLSFGGTWPTFVLLGLTAAVLAIELNIHQQLKSRKGLTSRRRRAR